MVVSFGCQWLRVGGFQFVVSVVGGKWVSVWCVSGWEKVGVSLGCQWLGVSGFQFGCQWLEVGRFQFGVAVVGGRWMSVVGGSRG